jgi:hypothetical protein
MQKPYPQVRENFLLKPLMLNHCRPGRNRFRL